MGLEDAAEDHRKLSRYCLDPQCGAHLVKDMEMVNVIIIASIPQYLSWLVTPRYSWRETRPRQHDTSASCESSPLRKLICMKRA